MNITIKTIPHDQQRCDTVGDWFWLEEDGSLQIRVSKMGNWKHEALVAFHELAEVLLCKDRGITAEMVDQFDMAYEAARPEGNTDEPGDDLNCPYRKEHFFATNVERLLATELGVDWAEYDEAVSDL